MTNDAIRRCTNPGVYLMHAVGLGAYKIGKTVRLGKRVSELTRQFPVEFRVLNFWRSDRYAELESGLHNVLRPFRMGRTDWFELPEWVLRKLVRFPEATLMKAIDKGEWFL